MIIQLLRLWWSFIFTSNVLPTDTFTQRMRKLLVGLCIHTVLIGAVAGAVMVYNYTSGELEPHHFYLMFLSTISSVLTELCIFVNTKKTLHVSRMGISAIGIVLCPTYIVVLLVNPMTSYVPIYFSISIYLLITEAYYAALIPVYVVLCFMTSYNIIVNGGGGALGMGYVIGIRDDTEMPMQGRIDDQLQTTGFMLCALVLVWLQKKEYASTIMRATRAQVTATSVARCLVRYSTSEARVAIENYRDDATACDKTLSDALSDIVTNFEAYRPFLPNYLIGTNLSIDPAAAENGDTRSNHSAYLLRLMHLSNVEYTHSVETLTDAGLVEKFASPTERSELASTARRKRSTHDLSMTCDVLSMDSLEEDDKSDASTNKQTTTSRRSQTHSPVSVPFEGDKPSTALEPPSPRATNPRRPQSVKAAMCLVSYKPLFQEGLSYSVFTDFTEHIREAAEETLGTIHTYFGDVLHVSWNTVRPVPHPEAYSILFLERCRQVTPLLDRKADIEAMEGSSSRFTLCSGAAYCGDATFFFCGKRLLVPMVTAPWLPQLRTLFQSYSERLQINVVDGDTLERCHRLIHHSHSPVSSFLCRRFDFFDRDNAGGLSAVRSDPTSASGGSGDHNLSSETALNDRSAAKCTPIVNVHELQHVQARQRPEGNAIFTNVDLPVLVSDALDDEEYHNEARVVLNAVLDLCREKEFGEALRALQNFRRKYATPTTKSVNSDVSGDHKVTTTLRPRRDIVLEYVLCKVEMCQRENSHDDIQFGAVTF
eukprot:PhM_4_TR8809/c0_g1_i1/m.48263